MNELDLEVENGEQTVPTATGRKVRERRGQYALVTSTDGGETYTVELLPTCPDQATAEKEVREFAQQNKGLDCWAVFVGAHCRVKEVTTVEVTRGYGLEYGEE